MLQQYSTQLFLLAIFFCIVYAVVEVIKHFFKALPDNWGAWSTKGPGKKATRWISFMVAYATAWTFDFQFITLILKSVNDNSKQLPTHANYFIIACILFVGAKWLHKKLTSQFNILVGKDEK